MISKEQYFTEIVLEIFRLNGRLIAAGDALVGPIGLTSARWQVLGAIVLLDGPAPVVRIADAMGLSRQAVQRVVDDMVQGGRWHSRIIHTISAPSSLRLTAKGRSLYGAATRLQRTWAAALVSGFDAATLQSAAKALAQLRARLETSLN